MAGSYREVLEYLYNLESFGMKLGLGSISRLLAELGSPEKSFRSVHIGGTNGKGSVCAFASSILSSSGFRVGMYTSPHLSTFRERIQVDGQLISEEEVVNCFNRVFEKAEMLKGELMVTYFEFVTAISFLHFRDRNVDFAVVEVGLGGRLDATNVIVPEVCAITHIALEHTEHLGNDLLSIAGEKAGIIKKGIPVVTAETRQDVLNLFSSVCKSKSSELLPVDNMFRADIISSGIDCLEMRVSGDYDYHLKVRLLGRHQARNVLVALCIAHALQSRGFGLANYAIRNGIESARWPGRIEVISRAPLVILDGAHNPDGMSALAGFARESISSKIILVLGISENKDIESMAGQVAFADEIIFCRARYRGADPWMILRHFPGVKARIIEDVVQAVKAAISDAKEKESAVIVSGSLFVVGEARTLWSNEKD
ncbi:bifunctional folylpolyglutamate synthase/dihydrofolate synthase [Candidatus Woesearchaeota archaeon]|nr:bifunctional folylpolyglutamate synthase/dihydrofolate synthase [Candidatus Woesearchaeota archaeon]